VVPSLRFIKFLPLRGGVSRCCPRQAQPTESSQPRSSTRLRCCVGSTATSRNTEAYCQYTATPRNAADGQSSQFKPHFWRNEQGFESPYLRPFTQVSGLLGGNVGRRPNPQLPGRRTRRRNHRHGHGTRAAASGAPACWPGRCLPCVLRPRRRQQPGATHVCHLLLRHAERRRLSVREGIGARSHPKWESLTCASAASLKLVAV
jgi:hypothetical protein